ncbi:alpha/beta hydrolase [Kitasatospora sp. NPDC101183]|uniref:alpha/beta hydrolase n=1 Tax=Kitasatospora sp. NPDC101183 TaxID=3364100 RepID=UPI0037F6C097
MTTDNLAAHLNPLYWPLTHGPIPKAVLLAGWTALILLALRRDRAWWRFGLPAALFTAAAVSLLLGLVVDGWLRPFPEGTPRNVTWWVATALLGLCLAGYRLRRSTWPRRAFSLGLGAVVVLMASSQVNISFDMYPNGRVMLAPWLDKPVVLVTTKADETVSAPPEKSLEEVWTPPPGLPAKGTVSQATIPGTKSGFRARNAYVYLPPAYQASPRPLLPVLVMITGQPGSPDEWVHQGQIDELMDAFAAKHGGLAPIVVMPDQLGAHWSNTLCMDSKIAKVQTYLAVDVPRWVEQNLQAATDRRSWAIGGASMGGTCALQMGVNAPDVYGTVLDISGQEEPTLGSRAATVKAAFGGDEAKFDAVDPVQVMARRKFPDTSVAVVVGDGDGLFRPGQEKVFKAVQGADMKATFVLVQNGGHAWSVFRTAVTGQLPWLGRQTGLIR